MKSIPARSQAFLLGAMLAATEAFAQAGGPLKNWFDDPFFQVRNGVKDCPVPLGPLTTGEEMQTQTHNRTERGTRCFQEGRCTKPNSFMYDKEIADGVRAKFAATPAYRDASLWVTIQRRIVWVEGCVAPNYRSGRLDKLVREVPDVELVVVNVRKRASDPAPYRRLDGVTAPRPAGR